MAHLMKYHLLQWEVVKVKFMNSNMILTVLNLHQKTDPKMQQDFKGQGHYDKVKSRSHHDDAHLHPPTNVPSKYQLPTPHRFQDIARTRFYRSPTNVPTKYQLPAPYGFRDIARTRFYRSRSLQQDQRSNQGQTMTLHTYTP